MEERQNWNAERTEAVARKLKMAGVTLVITNFHKGFGLKAEANEIEATRRFAEYLHHYGIRVGGYIGASMMYETFFKEHPEAQDWKQRDECGRPIYYEASQPFRYMACRNNPGYQEFINQLLRIGVTYLKLDLIHFDQMASKPEPDVCHCRFCHQQFIEYLRNRYSDAQLADRFGFTDLGNVLAPPFKEFVEARTAELVNPIMQDWIRFQAWSYAKRFREYDLYINSLNPNVALEGNPNIDFAYAKGSHNSVDYANLLDHGDIFWSEEPQQASWTSDGRLVSKVRSFKIARRAGKALFVYTSGSYGLNSSTLVPHIDDLVSPPQLRIAEALAYNDMNIGMVGAISPDGVSLSPEAQRYVEFFRTHKSLLFGTTPLADAAVLRSFAAVNFNPSKAHVSTVLYEQSLIQGKIPFAIVLNRDLASLSKYKVLILADQDALSDAELEAIRNFVANGGGLVATGDSSLLTEARVRRPKLGLSDLFGFDEPPKDREQSTTSRRIYKKGRVVYISEVVPSITPPPAEFNYRFGGAFWKLPRNHDDLIAAVEWASGERISTHVSAPLSVTLELAEQESSGTLLLHLVNYDYQTAITNIEVQLSLPPRCVGSRSQY